MMFSIRPSVRSLQTLDGSGRQWVSVTVLGSGADTVDPYIAQGKAGGGFTAQGGA